jgi:hypothetical protein
MSRIPLPETTEQKETLEVFKDIEATFGRVPNLLRAYALYPPTSFNKFLDALHIDIDF